MLPVPSRLVSKQVSNRLSSIHTSWILGSRQDAPFGCPAPASRAASCATLRVASVIYPRSTTVGTGSRYESIQVDLDPVESTANYTWTSVGLSGHRCTSRNVTYTYPIVTSTVVRVLREQRLLREHTSTLLSSVDASSTAEMFKCNTVTNTDPKSRRSHQPLHCLLVSLVSVQSTWTTPPEQYTRAFHWLVHTRLRFRCRLSPPSPSLLFGI